MLLRCTLPRNLQRIAGGGAQHRLFLGHQTTVRCAHLKGHVPVMASMDDGFTSQEELAKALQGVHNQFDPIAIGLTGVTFDNRQDHLSRVKQGAGMCVPSRTKVTTTTAGDPVQLTKEPDNPYDANAVHVTTLHGVSLGYIPRTLTHRITHPVSLGWVYSVGRGQDSGNLGAFIQVQPTRPCLTLTIIPNSLRVALGAVHEHPHFAAQCLAARDRTAGRCVFTNLPAARVVPRWLFLPKASCVQLAALYPVCQEVATLLAAEDGMLDDEEEALLRLVLAASNKWHPQHVEAHLAHQRRLAAQRASKRWRVDLSLLDIDTDVDTDHGHPLGSPAAGPLTPEQR